MQLIPLDIHNEAQLKFMFQVRTAPQVAMNLFGKPPETFEQHCAWINKQQGVRDIFMITEKYQNVFSEDLLGYCHIYNITDRSVEVGWAIHPDFHNKHYGTKSVYQLVKLCKKLYPLHDIELYVKTDNVPAIIIYIREGFMLCSITDGILHMKKQYQPTPES